MRTDEDRGYGDVASVVAETTVVTEEATTSKSATITDSSVAIEGSSVEEEDDRHTTRSFESISGQKGEEIDECLCTDNCYFSDDDRSDFISRREDGVSVSDGQQQK